MEILKLRKKSKSPWSILSFCYTTLFYFIGLCLDYNLGIILAFNFWVALFDYVVDGGIWLEYGCGRRQMGDVA